MAAQSTTLSLEVVQVNGVDLPGGPASRIEAHAGELLTLTAFLRDFSPEGQALRGYQMTVDFNGYSSGSAGNIFPVDFAATTDANGLCTAKPEGEAGSPNPQHAFINLSRADFVFGQGTVLSAVDTLSCSYRFFGALMNPADGPVSAQDGTKWYCGTIFLEVSAEADGTFVLGLSQAHNGSYLLDTNNVRIEPLQFQDATIVVGEARIDSADPPDGAVDGRQPVDYSGTNPAGWQSIDITFDRLLFDVAEPDFVVTELGGDGNAPSVSAVELIGDRTARITLDDMIEPGAWTIFTHNPSGTSVRIGSLPADVDGNGTSMPIDILTLIDALNGVIERPIFSTDVDRSGVAEPGDILRVIDLLNGANGPAWFGVSLP